MYELLVHDEPAIVRALLSSLDSPHVHRPHPPHGGTRGGTRHT